MRAGRALIGLALQFNNGAYDPRALALVTLAALLAIAAALRLRFEPSTRGLVRTGHGAQRALGGQPGANGVFVDEPRFQYWSYAAVVGARILVVKPTRSNVCMDFAFGEDGSHFNFAEVF